MRALSILVLAALCGAALAQTSDDCSRSVPNCRSCRYQFYRGTVTRAICTRCNTGYAVKQSGRSCW